MGFGDALGQAVAIHREAVIHRDDLHLAGGEVLDRMIGAVMALGHLPGLGAQRQSQHLMPQADAEYRRAGLDHPLDGGYGIFARCRRIAGAVGQQHTMRLVAHHFFGGGVGGHHGDVRAHPRQQAQDIPLHAIVDHGDTESRLAFSLVPFAPGPGHLAPFAGLACRDLFRQVQAFQPGKGFRLPDQGFAIQFTVTQIDHHAMRHAFFADHGGQGAGVDAGHRRNIVLLQPAIQRQQIAVVGGVFGVGAHDQPAHRRRHRLDVLVIGAHDADMREGEGDDLARVRRIAENLLIAGHGGVEADFADRRGMRAKPGAFEEGAVRQHEAATRKHGPRGGGVGRRCVGHGKPRICAKIGRHPPRVNQNLLCDFNRLELSTDSG